MSDLGGTNSAVLDDQDRAIAVTAIKAYLRIEGESEQEFLGTLAEAALGVAERFLACVTIARTLSLTVAADGGWQRLPPTPVSAIVSVGSRDQAGVVRALPSDAYAIDIDANAGGWIRASNAVGKAVLVVALSAGMAADWASLPAAIRQGVVMLAAYLYDNRDGAGAPPAAVTALWRPYRRMRLAERVPA
ncbi:MAG: head-tail connector protein [Sphingomonas sp.]